MASPAKLAHVVLRTAQHRTMLDWYNLVLEGHTAYVNDVLAFMTYDDEHHRMAFLNMGAQEHPTYQHCGMDHVAFTYDNLGDLLATYVRLKGVGVKPHWTINHGPTTSMYFRDPDDNQVELQIDNFATAQEVQAYLDSGKFHANPIGVEFDPDELVARFEAGEPVAELVKVP